MTELPLADRSVELVQTWVAPPRHTNRRPDPAAQRLTTLLRDPRGLEFTIGLIDRVARIDDHRAAARNLRELTQDLPQFLTFGQRLMLKLGPVAAVIFPGIVATIARRTVRQTVGHLIVEATPDQLSRSIKKLRANEDRLHLNVLGGPVLGDAEATRRRDMTLELLQREDVDRVSVAMSEFTSHLSMWAFDDAVDDVVKQLTPLYAEAADTQRKFISLDLEQHKDLQLTLNVFTTLLDSFPHVEAGIALPANLPESLDAMKSLQEWASRRRTAGGAPITVRVVQGANHALEHVDAVVCGWPLATWATTQETDTHFKRLLHWALRPERTDAVRIAVASQNLFDIAYAEGVKLFGTGGRGC